MELTFKIETTDPKQVAEALKIMSGLTSSPTVTNIAVTNVVATNEGTKAASDAQKAAAAKVKADADAAAVKTAKAKADAANKAKADKAAELAAANAAAAKAVAFAKAQAQAKANATEEATNDEPPFDIDDDGLGDDTPTYTMEEVRAKLKAYMALTDKATALAVLKDIGMATSVGELDAANYSAVVKACKGV